MPHPARESEPNSSSGSQMACGTCPIQKPAHSMAEALPVVVSLCSRIAKVPSRTHFTLNALKKKKYSEPSKWKRQMMFSCGYKRKWNYLCRNEEEVSLAWKPVGRLNPPRQYGGDLPASWNSPVCFMLLGWSPALAYVSVGRGINDNWKIPWLLVINVVDRSWKG